MFRCSENWSLGFGRFDDPGLEITAFTAYGRIAVVAILLWIPGICVVVAGFQNIDDSDPPAATPAYDDPCP
jgi:hypothetical protein